MQKYQQITPESLKKFKSLVLSRSSLNESEYTNMQSLDEVLRPVFKDLYYGDIELAEAVMGGNVSEELKSPVVDRMAKVAGMRSAVEKISSALNSDRPVVCIASEDEHAITALSINEVVNTILENPIKWAIQKKDLGEYSLHDASVTNILEQNNMNQHDDFVLVTLGMGSQQKAYQAQFAEKYPKAHWVVFDHHLFNIDHQIEFQKPGVTWVSPYSESELSEGKRPKISSGFLYQLAMKSVLSKMEFPTQDMKVINKALNDAGVVCNKLAGVAADIRLMPISKPQLNAVADIEKIIGVETRLPWLNKEEVEEVDNKISYLTDGQMSGRAKEIASKITSQVEMSNALVALLESELINKAPESIKSELISTVMKNKGASIDENTINRLKVHFVHYKFNANVSAEPGLVINEVMTRLAKVINGAGSEIKSILRELNSIQVLEHPNLGLVKPDSEISSALFTEKDWRSAFSMRDKNVQGLVRDDEVGELRFFLRSSGPLGPALARLKSQFEPGYRVEYSGTGFSSQLTFKTIHGQPINLEMQNLIFTKLEEQSEQLSQLRLTKPIVKVDPFSIDVLMKVNETTGASAYAYDDYQVKGALSISSEMTIKVNEQLKKVAVEELVNDALWSSTSVALKFDNSQRIIFPTRLIKSMHENGYQGLLNVSQISKGVVIANGYLDPASVERAKVITFDTELEKQKHLMADYYQKELGEDKTKQLTREEMISSIKFVSDPEQAFNDHEALTLSYLDKSNSDAFVVLDIEANDGGTAPKCFNVGMVSYTIKEGSGKEISEQEYESIKFTNGIRNTKKLENGHYLVNREIEGEKLSLIINEGDMAIPVKAEKLTNMDSKMVQELGMSAAEAELIMLDFVGRYDRYISQAHNYLGYDLAGIAANFPQLHQDILENVVVDSVLPARAFAIGQSNMMVSGLGLAGSKAAFATTPGSRFNVISKLRDESLTTFTFPDIKGETLLRVSGQDVYVIDAKTNSGSKMRITRNELADRMIANSAPQFGRSAKSGIAPLIKLATIFDVLEQSSVESRVHIEFDDLGVNVPAKIEKAFELFQSRYSPTQSIAQNIGSLLRNHPDIENALSAELVIPLSEQPIGLQDVMLRGVDQKTQKTKKFQQARENVKVRDLFEYNANRFVEENKESFAYGSESWIYDVVLSYTNPLDASESIEKGIAKRTGIPLNMVQEVIENTQQYMEKHNLRSLFVEETHNNIDLAGDDFQEGIVVSHLMVSKLTDPFFPRHDVSQAIDKIYPYAVGATIEALAKKAFLKNTPSYAVNSHEYKQLRTFDVAARGISDSGIEQKHVSLNVKKSDKDKVIVRLPHLTIGEYESYSDDVKEQIQEAVSNLVFTSMLRNSVNERTDQDVARLVDAICESGATKQRIQFIKDMAPGINIDNTEKEKGLMALLRNVSDAISSGKDIKLSANKFITGDEIDAFIRSYEGIVDVIHERMGVDLSSRMDDVKAALNLAKVEYECIDLVRKTGSAEHLKDFDKYMHRGLKSAVTATLKVVNGADQELREALPEFASTMVSKKTDVAMMLLDKNSPHVLSSLLDEHVPSLSRDPEQPDVLLSQTMKRKR